MNVAQIYATATTPKLPAELEQIAKQNQTEQSLKESQLHQVKDSWLQMNYTQSFLASLYKRCEQLQMELQNHVLSQAEPSKDYILRNKIFEMTLLNRIIEMAKTGNHNYINNSNNK